MKQRWRNRISGRSLKIIFFLALLVSSCIITWRRSPWFGLPFRDDFSSGQTSGWTAYAGNWTVIGNAVRNDSDERGAKLMTGSDHWTSYAMEADLQMLGGGDAGILIRATHVEEGVDAYDGYYAGLRTNDQSLVLGRAQHGWYEFPFSRMPGGVIPGKWYHLRLAAQGCVLSASATEIGTKNTAQIKTLDPQCLKAGSAGLRSMGAGGLWRNVRISSLPAIADTKAILPPVSHLALYPTSQGSAPLTIATNPVQNKSYRSSAESVQTIRSLRLLSISKPAHVVVRGAVILTDPSLYVQDSSGGVKVETTHPGQLRVGDEVEVEGDAYPEGLSATIRNSTARVVGGLAPIPPLSVTADQAASGAYDSMFVEVEGRLIGRMNSVGRSVLEFRNGTQTYRALTNSEVTRSEFDRLETESIVRLRGACLVRPEYTGNTVPFVLIVDSPENVKLLVGPPWWSVEHLIFLALAMLGMGFLGHLFYSRAEEWRWRAVLNERERMAHEMHDTLSQSFAGIGFQIRGIRNRLLQSSSQVDPHLLDELNTTSELVRHSHDEARRSIACLRPEVLEVNGLVSALEQSARRAVARGSVTVHALNLGEPRPLPLGVLDALFRIAQEAIANAIHHGHPKSIKICMEYERSSVVLMIEDDGKGFIHQPERSGFGLAGMQRRAESIDAILEIHSSPGNGCRIIVHLPTPHISLLRRLAYSRYGKREFSRNA